jgi:hypothetical protein
MVKRRKLNFETVEVITIGGVKLRRRGWTLSPLPKKNALQRLKERYANKKN